MLSFKEYIFAEDTTAGGGQIAGIGVNPDGSEYNSATATSSFGEPGMKPENAQKYKKKNKKEAEKWHRKITTIT